MTADTSPALTRLLARAERDPDILAVMLFGSRARGDASPGSDVDVCLVLTPVPRSKLAEAQKRLDYLAEADVDVVVFQHLPLAIQSRILREGHVLYVRHEDALYELAIRSVKAFERFRPIHQAYLDEVARG